VVPKTSARSATKVPENPLAIFLPAEERANEGVRKGRVLISDQMTLPCPATDGVGAGRPEIGAPTEEHAVSEDEYSTVAALYAVEHIGVNRIKPVLHLLLPARRHHATDSYVFLVGATREDKQLVIHQWSLQLLGPHPRAAAPAHEDCPWCPGRPWTKCRLVGFRTLERLSREVIY
jgi:hypothetical protein